MKLKVNPNDLTLGEVQDLEDTVGVPFGELFKQGEDSLPIKALVALVWIMRRREDADFTLEDARGVKLTDIETEAPEENPTENAA